MLAFMKMLLFRSTAGQNIKYRFKINRWKGLGPNDHWAYPEFAKKQTIVFMELCQRYAWHAD